MSGATRSSGSASQTVSSSTAGGPAPAAAAAKPAQSISWASRLAKAVANPPPPVSALPSAGMTPAGVAVVPPAAAVSAATSSSASSQVGDSGHNATTNGVNNGHSSSSIPWDLSPGAVVRLTLVTNTVVEGTVFTCDQRSRMLAVYAAVPNSDAKNVSVVPLDAIKAVHYIQKTTDRGPKYDLAVNETEMKRREVMALQQRREESYKINPVASDLAQAIFDAFDKLLPTRWKGETIVVMDDVTISPPYTQEACVGGKEEPLARVKKVLEDTRKRLKL